MASALSQGSRTVTEATAPGEIPRPLALRFPWTYDLSQSGYFYATSDASASKNNRRRKHFGQMGLPAHSQRSPFKGIRNSILCSKGGAAPN
jgi:hypothetical protein